MNLKLKRSTRTPYSEEMLVYDLDNLDAEERPVEIGKLDVHYIEDQIVGTLLISQEFATGYARTHGGGTGGQAALDDLINEVLAEVSEPIGVSATYAIEVYYASFAQQGFFSNYGDSSQEESEEAGSGYEEEYDAGLEEEEERYLGSVPASPDQPLPEPSTLFPSKEDDDFTRRLRER